MPCHTRALGRVLLLGACAWPALASADEAPPTVDSVIVTGARNPEDPPVVQEARARLSETPGAVSVVSQESYANRFAVALDDMRNTTKAPSYAVWNLGAGYALDRVTLFLDIRNLGDKSYISNVQAQIAATAASAAYWPGDGRSLFGGLAWSF